MITEPVPVSPHDTLKPRRSHQSARALSHPRCAPARRDADPAAQQDRPNDGDLHRDPLGRHPRRPRETRAMARRVNPVAALCCCTKIQKGRSQDRNRPLSWEPRYGIEPCSAGVRSWACDGSAHQDHDGARSGGRRRCDHLVSARVRAGALARGVRGDGAVVAVHRGRPDLGRVHGGTGRQPTGPAGTTAGGVEPGYRDRGHSRCQPGARRRARAGWRTVHARHEAAHSQRAIARELNIDRRKVKRILEQAA